MELKVWFSEREEGGGGSRYLKFGWSIQKIIDYLYRKRHWCRHRILPGTSSREAFPKRRRTKGGSRNDHFWHREARRLLSVRCRHRKRLLNTLLFRRVLFCMRWTKECIRPSKYSRFPGERLSVISPNDFSNDSLIWHPDTRTCIPRRGWKTDYFSYQIHLFSSFETTFWNIFSDSGLANSFWFPSWKKNYRTHRNQN